MQDDSEITMTTMTTEFYEECWFIYGFRLRNLYIGFLKYHSKGTAGSVEFDWHKALTPFLIGWYHSHPGVKFLTPSSIDNSTMRSWIKGLYKPLLCGIFCSGEQKCYCYYVGEDSTDKKTVVRRNSVRARLYGSFFIGKREPIRSIIV